LPLAYRFLTNGYNIKYINCQTIGKT
jgi:hypothetical protein